MRFSILMCSRARPDILETNVTNILSLADNPEEVEILIGADEDDMPTINRVCELQEYYAFRNIHLIVNPRFKNLHKFYNLLASKAIGKYVWGMNDDSIVEYANWDTDFCMQIEKILIPYPDRIGYFAISSNSSDKLGDYGEFPIVTREALTTLGFMDYEGTNSWGCDQVMHNIYKSVGRAFTLKVDRPMRHIYHESNSAPNENREFMKKVFAEQFGHDWAESVNNMQTFISEVDISQYSNKLLNKIQN